MFEQGVNPRSSALMAKNGPSRGASARPGTVPRRLPARAAAVRGGAAAGGRCEPRAAAADRPPLQALAAGDLPPPRRRGQRPQGLPPKSPSPSLFLSQRGTPISRRQLDTLMKRCGALADIPAAKRHFHVLKHSIATHLLDAGEVVVQLPQPRPVGLDVGVGRPRLVPPGHVRQGVLRDDAQGT